MDTSPTLLDPVTVEVESCAAVATALAWGTFETDEWTAAAQRQAISSILFSQAATREHAHEEYAS